MPCLGAERTGTTALALSFQQTCLQWYVRSIKCLGVTDFSTAKECYEYLVMPYGLVNATLCSSIRRYNQ